MNKKSHTVATITLVVVLLSIFLPATTLSASANSAAIAMPKTQDIFGGSFSPNEKVAASGETFDVTFSLCPTMDAPDTVITFVLPADLVELVSGDKTWTGDLKQGESVTLTLSLVANGEVEAYVKADVEALLSGKDYRSSYYLRVATPNADTIPNASGEMEPGFFRAVKLEYVSKASSPIEARAVEDLKGPVPAAGNIEVKGQFWYVDENGGWSAARYMLARLRDNDDAGFSVTQWTGGDGKFDFVVANSAGKRSPILDIIAEGAWDWKATNDAGAQYWWSTGVLQYDVPDGWLYEDNGLGVASNSETLQAGDAVFLEMNWVYWMSGVYWSRGKVTIRFPSGTWPHSHGDYIDLPSKSTAGWNHVTVQHEDGHCVMYTLWGNSWPSTAHMGESHYVFDEKDGGFAMIEGWAEFMQCAVDNNPANLADWYNGHGGNVETNDWFNCVDTGDMDGNDIEGSMASILWDILDPVNTAGDNDHMAWDYDEIFVVMQNDHPGDMLTFWNDWAARWPDNSTSKGPLCSIYYHYGIDEDWFNPWGSIIINGGDLCTTSRTVTLALDGEDWGVGVQYMRFSEDLGLTWGPWYTYSTTFSYTITKPGDGYKWIDVQFADLWWLSNGGTIYDGITLDTVAPTGSIVISSGNPTYTTTRSVTLYLTYSDATSGVDKVRYGNAGQPWAAWEVPSPTRAWALQSGDGTKRVYYQVRDKAGKISEYYDEIILDTVAPVTTIGHSPGSSTVTLSATDATSGVGKTYYRIDGSAWDVYTVDLTLAAGTNHKIECYSVDKAGNTETIKSLTVHYLTVNTAPTGLDTPTGEGWYNHGTNASIGVSAVTDYNFKYWYLDGASGTPYSTSMSAKVLMNTKHMATAKFVFIPKITSFTVSPSPFSPKGVETDDEGNTTFSPNGYGADDEASTTFSPNGDGINDEANITATFNTNVNWNLQVRTTAGVVKRTWTGTGNAFTIIWDGKNETGAIVPDGTYKLRLSGKDLAGTSFTTKTIQVKVDDTPPTVTGVSVKPSSFDPKLGQTTRINFTISETCRVTVAVYNSTGGLIRTLMNNAQKAAGAYSVVWNGKDSANKIVPPGIYKIKIFVTDIAGNKATTYPIQRNITIV